MAASNTKTGSSITTPDGTILYKPTHVQMLAGLRAGKTAKAKFRSEILRRATVQRKQIEDDVQEVDFSE